MTNTNEIANDLGNAYEALGITASTVANAVTLYNITQQEEDYKRVQVTQSNLELRQETLRDAFYNLFIAHGIEYTKARDMAKCAVDSATHTLLHKAYSEITIA